MIKIQKGTKDVLPFESYKWHFVENKVRNIAKIFGLKEIRTPTFEATELFLRGVGETTDIVNKEMYTFLDKGDRSITLKPEGTAGVARSFVENNLDSFPQPTKMYYITPVFRYERPQSGRLREHHQFGIEYYGSDSPLSDVEVIMVAKAMFDGLGIRNVKLNINSIGCPVCRAKYNEVLRAYLNDFKDKLCPTCNERLIKNPLRILDCKEEGCIEINKDAPVMLDYLCEDCQKHHNEVMDLLNFTGIDFSINPHIVRGLDYYTKTVFEFVSTAIGSQGTVCGGGRYNNLVSEVGGKSTPAIGFGMGIERLLMVMESGGLYLGEEDIPLIYVAPLGDNQYKEALKLVYELRNCGISAETDYLNRSLKAQMKYADKIGYNYVIVLGENEIKEGKVFLKNMKDKENSKEVFLKDLKEVLKKDL